MEEINARLDQVKEELRFYKKLTSSQERLRDEIQEAKTKLNHFKAQLDKENRDVEKLEGWTITGFMLVMTGKKEERLQLEKEEAVKAKLQYDEWHVTVKELEEEDREVSEKLIQLGNPERKYGMLLEEKEKLIHDSSSPLSDLLYNLAEQSAELKVGLKEVKEAEEAAAMARLKLDTASDLLGSAKNWGMLDLAGGDLISTYAKRSKMDEAQRALHEAQRYLKRLEKELQDLNMEAVQTLEVSGFLSLTDMFFDNFFSDLMVQDKINRTISQVSDTRSRISVLSSKLAQMANELTREIKDTEAKKRKHLESA